MFIIELNLANNSLNLNIFGGKMSKTTINCIKTEEHNNNENYYKKKASRILDSTPKLATVFAELVSNSKESKLGKLG
jgi:hypothetical protein